MKHSFYCAVSMIILCSQLHAMTTKPKDEITIPNENFQVSIIDRDDIKTSGQNATFNEYTFLSVKKGSMDITIPFERLTGFTVVSVTDQQIDLEVTLRDGEVYRLSASPDDSITGEAEFGQFRIELRHVKQFSVEKSLLTATPAMTYQSGS